MPDFSVIAGKDLERYFNLQQALAEFHELFNHGDNDREIAIVGGAFLDSLLEYILINFFVDDEKEVLKLLEPERPLGTYGSRVTMGFCLGLFHELIRDDLRTVGKIRNRFAHDLQASFDQDPIRSWCVSLKWHEISHMKTPEGATAREIFQVGVNQLITYLHGVVSIARGEKRQIVRWH